MWRLVQLGTDNKTLEIRAAEFPGGDVGDGPMLPDRLKRIPFHLEIGRVRADTAGRALGTRKCHDTTARARQAVMPPRKNATPWKPDTAGAAVRNEALRASRRLGLTIWRRWSGYPAAAAPGPRGMARSCRASAPPRGASAFRPQNSRSARPD